MKLNSVSTIAIIVVFSICFFVFSSPEKQSVRLLVAKVTKPAPVPYKPLPFDEARSFVKKKKMDTNLAIFIHYRKHSGKKRGYIIDLAHKIVIDSFMVAHGCGSSNWGTDGSKGDPAFSNAPESHCSSLGKYKIGARAYSDWGINIKYFLYGLESTNTNAYNRTIVLHGWGDIPDEETWPFGVAEGWGCPAVSNKTMTKLDSLLSNAKKPVLLWAY